jgi:hypothetical protein
VGNNKKEQRERERAAAAELTRFVYLVEERVADGGMKHRVPPEERAQLLRNTVPIL